MQAQRSASPMFLLITTLALVQLAGCPAGCTAQEQLEPQEDVSHDWQPVSRSFTRETIGMSQILR